MSDNPFNVDDITKVFTKYDIPHDHMLVPVILDLEAEPFSDDAPIKFLPYSVVKLPMKRMERGLMGVKFITYGVTK